jgi:hypothetical protein
MALRMVGSLRMQATMTTLLGSKAKWGRLGVRWWVGQGEFGNKLLWICHEIRMVVRRSG